MTRLTKKDFRPARAWIEALPPDTFARVEAAAAANIEAAHLSQLRKALAVTQSDLAERTGLKQAEVSRIENAVETVQLKTLQRYVSGLGGTMTIVARFPDGAQAEIPMKNGRPVRSRAKVSAGGRTAVRAAE